MKKYITNGFQVLLWVSSFSFSFVYAGTPESPVDACNGLQDIHLHDTQLSLVSFNAATDDLPEHCEVIGAIDERVSPVDGQTYAIRFHLRMPTDWNRRFYFTGGGGSDGSLGNADAAVIHEGYAIVSTDSGHDNSTNVSDVAGSFQFGFDPQARSDFGYNGPKQTALVSKRLIRTFYGKRPKYSYFVGCSEGGREGLMFSQRYPDFFDGIVAGNPGMDLPKAAVAEAWDSQAFARAAQQLTPFGNPDLASSFSDADLAAVANAVLAACDADDGLEDGMLFNPQACDFDPTALGPAGSGNLSAAQVSALQDVFDGARNSSGKALYSGWYWDPGIAAFGWRQWKIGPLFPGFPVPGNSGINVTLGGGALPFIFTTPPNSMTHGTDLAPGSTIATANPLGIPGATNFGDAYVPWVLGFDMDKDAPKIYARDGVYKESAMDFMGTSSVDYRRFKKKGNKLIVYTGQADPVFSARYHEAWYRRLIKHNHGTHHTRGFARLFMVPGMNHCGGGPATSQFDAFTALVDWVEQHKAPDRIIATAPAGTPWPGRTRPLCAYPQQARYTGDGDIEDAENFVCVTPGFPGRWWEKYFPGGGWGKHFLPGLSRHLGGDHNGYPH